MYLVYRTTGLKISGFTLSDLYMTKLTITSFFLHCTAYTYIFACAMRSVFVCSCILCVKSVVWGFPCVTGVDHNFMSHFISLTLTHWTLHESMIQVGSQKKKKKRKKISDMTSWNSQVELSHSVSGGRAVVNQWKSSLWGELVQTASHFRVEFSVKTTKQKSVHYPHKTGHRDLPA